MSVISRTGSLVLLCSATALTLAGCSAPERPTAVDTRPLWEQGPSLEVIGRAFREEAPNRARFSVTYQTKAETSEAASAAAVERANAATAAMREVAGEDALRVQSDLSVQPYYRQVSVRINEFEERLQENVHPDALLGYVARVTVAVEVLKPAQASLVRGAALALGPQQSGALGFYLEPDASLQRDVFADAMADAAARAKAAAAATGAKLAGVLVAQEGSGPCRGQSQGAMGRSAMMDHVALRSAPAPAPTMNAGRERAEKFALAADQSPQQLSSSVCVIYALK